MTRIKNRKTPKGNKSKRLNKILPKENKEPPEDEQNMEPSISRQNLKPLQVLQEHRYMEEPPSGTQNKGPPRQNPRNKEPPSRKQNKDPPRQSPISPGNRTKNKQELPRDRNAIQEPLENKKRDQETYKVSQWFLENPAREDQAEFFQPSGENKKLPQSIPTDHKLGLSRNQERNMCTS